MTAPDIRAAVTGAERARERRAARDASGEMYVDGSIYEGMEACLARSGKTVAHVMRYADAVEIVAAFTDRERLERELAEARVERDEALMVAEGPSTLRELASCSIANVHARHEAEQRALAAEARCKVLEEALETIDAPWFDTDGAIDEIRSIARAALTGERGMSGPKDKQQDWPYPGHDQPHCKKCELPKDICACAEARHYDRFWRTRP